MKLFSAIAATAALLTSIAMPASARDEFVTDGAQMFKASTVSGLNQAIGDFNRQTGKEVVVVTVPSLGSDTIANAAEKTFAQQQVNGVLIFLAKAERKDLLVPDRASVVFFPAGTLQSVHQAMRGYFRSGDYDEGITTGVNLVIDQYRSHERALPGTHRTSYAPSTSSFGGGMSLFWIILILIAGFLIIRAIFRAIAGPRMMPPGYGGGPGFGGPGYGGGYGGGGFGGGGGGFFSGLLGGLGGAFIGNELFGRHDGDGFNNNAGMMGGDGGSGDSSGWSSDPGQADMGASSGGGFGGDGGGFGGGDGGGFGGDGGGGGDGGW